VIQSGRFLGSREQQEELGLALTARNTRLTDLNGDLRGITEEMHYAFSSDGLGSMEPCVPRSSTLPEDVDDEIVLANFAIASEPVRSRIAPPWHL
jgi:hypothetical protein